MYLQLPPCVVRNAHAHTHMVCAHVCIFIHSFIRYYRKNHPKQYPGETFSSGPCEVTTSQHMEAVVGKLTLSIY